MELGLGLNDPVVNLMSHWTRSRAYRLSNERSASSTVDPIPAIPSVTLDPRNAIHNSLRNDNCGGCVAVGLLGCAAQYFIISSLACSGVLICTFSTNTLLFGIGLNNSICAARQPNRAKRDRAKKLSSPSRASVQPWQIGNLDRRSYSRSQKSYPTESRSQIDS